MCSKNLRELRNEAGDAEKNWRQILAEGGIYASSDPESDDFEETTIAP
jgi:hypothetical protein